MKKKNHLYTQTYQRTTLLFYAVDQDHSNGTEQLGDQKDHLCVLRPSGAAQTQHQQQTQDCSTT